MDGAVAGRSQPTLRTPGSAGRRTVAWRAMTRRPVRRRLCVIALGLGGLVALAGCGSPAATSGSPPHHARPSTSTSIPSGLDGAEADQLPGAPSPTAPPSLPDPSTPAGRQQFLAQVFGDIQQMWS